MKISRPPENPDTQDFEDWFGVSMSGLAGPTHPAIDWVIVGGESGPGARPMHPDWARSLRDQCVAAGVPFLFKQWGEFAPEGVGADAWHVYPDGVVARDPLPAGVGRHVPSGHWRAYRTGKEAAGRMLDGRTWDETPGAVGTPK